MVKDGFAVTPSSDYYAVIFTTQRSGEDSEYTETADRMVELATEQPGFLGVESARGADGFGITVSYWTDEDAIRAWKQNVEHRLAQQKGISDWYARYELRVARVQRSYGRRHA